MISTYVDWNIRSAVMAQLEALAEGEAYAQQRDASSYFEDFFDWMPLESHVPFENAAMTEEEVSAVEHVRSLMVEACESTPQQVTAAVLIASNWPLRIAEQAQAALNLMNVRGHRPNGWVADPRDMSSEG